MGDKRYQVVGECAHVVVTDVSGVSAVNLLYKGAYLPDGVDEKRLQHLIDSKLVAEEGEVPVAPNASVPRDASVGIPPVESGDTGEPTGGEDGGDSPAGGAELTADQQAAKAQLPADGSVPDGRKSDAVFVEYLVGRGYDRGEVSKAAGKDLRRLAADAGKGGR